MDYLSAGHKKGPLGSGDRCGEVTVSGGSTVFGDYSIIAGEMILLTGYSLLYRCNFTNYTK